MGSLYTQHFAGSKAGMVGGRHFELVYRGELAGMSNTRPLYAALVKGLTSPISDAGGRDVNIVNAGLIAKQKGLAIDERKAAQTRDDAFASLVTLRSFYGDRRGGHEQVIEGYTSGKRIYISKLDRFSANFPPEGTLLVLHNYDQPGKIGNVGMILGKYGINVQFMEVGSLEAELPGLSREAEEPDTTLSDMNGGTNGHKSPAHEALMILGVSGSVTKEVLDELGRSDGILHVSVVNL
jgi:D-3-phosphoglycerate dehydrogenase / 2-oxoglutarate reductase